MSDTTERRTPDGEPLVSIIMAAYNCAQYVGEAIESILAQSHGNWELVCLDDASTDGTRDIIAGYAEADERIDLICNAQNRGPAAARNIALEHATGEFVAVLDADDVACEDRLEKSLEVFARHPEVDVLAGGTLQINERGEELGRYRDVRGVHSSVMARRTAIRNVGGYDEFFPAAQDTDLLCRLSVHHQLAFLDYVIAMYRVHDRQLSLDRAHEQLVLTRLAYMRREALRRGEIFDLQEQYELLMSDVRFRASCLYDQGRRLVSRNQTAQARAVFRAAMALRRGHMRTYVQWALSFLPGCLRRRIDRAWQSLGQLIHRDEGTWQWPFAADDVPVYRFESGKLVRR